MLAVQHRSGLPTPHLNRGKYGGAYGLVQGPMVEIMVLTEHTSVKVEVAVRGKVSMIMSSRHSECHVLLYDPHSGHVEYLTYTHFVGKEAEEIK